MGVCFSNPTLKTVPIRENNIAESFISKSMKLVNVHDDYKFIKVLGHGQFGTVREAIKLNTQNSSLEKNYAIKSIPKKKMNVTLLRRELEIMSQLDHPNLVKLYETYEDEHFVHLVMEFCSGGDVSERIIDKGTFSEQEAAGIMKKLISALEYLHSHNICHRDLKPENFLYESRDESSEIKIADFGMSVKFGSNMRMKSLAGTPYYLAPEVIKGSYTKACDVWSLGVFLYFILSGLHPFRGFDMEEIFEKISKGSIKFVGKEWGGISHQATDLISKMLTIDPKKRVSTQKALQHTWFVSFKNTETQPVPFHIFDSLKQYKAQSKLWQEAVKVAVRSLSSQEISELKKWFLAIDKNNSGTITAAELEEAMKLSGYLIAETELKAIVENISYLDKGTINYSEFLVATIDKKKIVDKEIIWQAFQFFDVDNDGVISQSDFKSALSKSGRSMEELESDKEGVLKEFQEINFERFKEILMKSDDDDETGHHFSRVVRRLSVEYMM